LNGKEVTLRKRMHAEIADSLTLMTMLLPATPILKINDTLSAKEVFATLSKTRKNLPFLYGETKTDVLNNGTVFVYTR
jgi:solute carrier family 3 protein 2